MLGLAAACVLAFGAGRASADQTYYIDQGNTALQAFPAPPYYATAVVHLDSSTMATITFDVGPNFTTGGHTYSYTFAGTDTADVNVNASSFSVSNITVVPAVGSPSFSSTHNVDGQGTFNARIDSGSGGSSVLTTEVKFDVTRSTGTWGSAADVLTNTGSGVTHFAAAHIAVAVDGVIGSSNTGFAGDGPFTPPPPTPQSVPEPSSTALAAVGALGFVVFGLRRRLKK
jgi:hypothetical protein